MSIFQNLKNFKKKKKKGKTTIPVLNEYASNYFDNEFKIKAEELGFSDVLEQIKTQNKGEDCLGGM